jgi:hypothetical protein
MRSRHHGCVLVVIEQNKAPYENVETGVLTRKLIDPDTSEEVPREATQKGYEVERGTLDPEQATESSSCIVRLSTVVIHEHVVVASITKKSAA